MTTRTTTDTLTLPAALHAAITAHEGVALRLPSATDPALSFGDVARAGEEIAAGLAALGIEPGDRVAILAGTRPEWTLADLGALCAGRDRRPDLPAPTRPRSASTCSRTPASRAIFCEDAAQVAKIDEVRDALPRARARDRARRRRAGRDDARRAARARARRRATAWSPSASPRSAPRTSPTIVYTSGTTGPPKGCVSPTPTCSRPSTMYTRAAELLRTPTCVIYLFLPLAHSLARVAAVRGARGRRDAGVLGRRPEADRRGAGREPRRRTSRRSRASTRRSTRRAQRRRGRAAVKRAHVRVGAARRARGRARPTASGARPAALARLRHALADKLVLSKVRARVRRPAGDGAHRRGADRRARCSSSSTPAACWCSRATA